MTLNESIDALKVAEAEVEWEYPLDYKIAFDTIVRCIGECKDVLMQYVDGDIDCHSLARHLKDLMLEDSDFNPQLEWKHILGAFTPGGDPYYVCPVCGKSGHCHGVESTRSLRRCPNCNTRLKYPRPSNAEDSDQKNKNEVN